MEETMAFHVAPLIREMENARVTLGVLQNLNTVGYTVTSAQESAGTRPTPSVTPAGGLGNFWFLNQKTVPAL
jgi:hypothetical protein